MTYVGPSGARRGRGGLPARLVLRAHVEARAARLLADPAQVAAAAVGAGHRPVEPDLDTPHELMLAIHC